MQCRDAAPAAGHGSGNSAYARLLRVPSLAVAYLVSGLVVLLFPPRVGLTMGGTVPWWVVGGGLFLAYIGTSALLKVHWKLGTLNSLHYSNPSDKFKSNVLNFEYFTLPSRRQWRRVLVALSRLEL